METKEDLKTLIEAIAQADTGSAIQNMGLYGIVLIETAISLTKKYKFFKYWD